MPKKWPPILRRAWNFFILGIPMEKLKKPISQNLPIFKKARKIKTLNFLKRHYSYPKIEEYQFSPPSTPLLNGFSCRFTFKKRTLQALAHYPLLLCHSRSDGEEGEDNKLEASALFRSKPDPIVFSESEEEGESIDRQAEEFIERFYEEMRMQRQESPEECTEMLD